MKEHQKNGKIEKTDQINSTDIDTLIQDLNRRAETLKEILKEDAQFYYHWPSGDIKQRKK